MCGKRLEQRKESAAENTPEIGGKSCCDLLKEKRKAPKIGGSRQRSGGEGAVSSTKMGEADVLMPEKVVESLLGENGDLIQVVVMMMVIVIRGCPQCGPHREGRVFGKC